MEKMEWLREVEIEDLLEGDMKTLYERCGKELFYSLLETAPKSRFYIASEKLKRAIRRRYVEKHYDGTNKLSLAVRLGVSTKTIERILQELGERRS